MIFDVILHAADAPPTEGVGGGLSDKWVGLIGAAIGASFALAGSLLTALLSRGENEKDRQEASKLARSAASLELSRLREERMRATYVEVLTWVSRCRRYLVDLDRTDSPWPGQGYADEELEAKLDVMTDLDCTPAFREELSEFARTQRDTIWSYNHWRDARAANEDPDQEWRTTSHRANFEDRQNSLHDLHQSLVELARADLEALTALPES